MERLHLRPLTRIRDNRLLSPDAELGALTTIVLSAIQGGLLLAKTSRDADKLRTAMAGAIIQLKSHGPHQPRV